MTLALKPSLQSQLKPRYKLSMTPQAQQDIAYWEQHDQAIAGRVLKLLKNLQQGHTFPAQQATQLKFGKVSLISLKISAEHRLVVELLGEQFIVHQCRFHY
jgi:toxin YoeB